MNDSTPRDVASIIEDTKSREPEKYGDVLLSVQANAYTYCTPRVSGLALEDYSHVEIALIPTKDHPNPPKFRMPKPFSTKERTGFLRPSDLGIEGFDDLFEDDTDVPVAAYAPQERVEQLREHLRKYAAKQEADDAETS